MLVYQRVSFKRISGQKIQYILPGDNPKNAPWNMESNTYPINEAFV